MAKNIALSKEAYGILERLKRPGESFSDLVKRMSESKKPNWRDSIGAWKDGKEIDRIFDRILNDRHKSSRRPVSRW